MGLSRAVGGRKTVHVSAIVGEHRVRHKGEGDLLDIHGSRVAYRRVTRTTSVAAIERDLDLAAPPSRVWRVLTDPVALGHWFCDEAAFSAEPGADGTFAWHGRGHTAFRVERVEPPRHLAWRWACDPGVPLDDGPATLVEWWLVPAEDGGTRLTIRESGFLERDQRRRRVPGWLEALRSLSQYLERRPGVSPGIANEPPSR